MSEATIPLYAQLLLRREKLQQELTQAGSDIQSWAQQLTTVSVNVKITPDRTALDALIAELQTRPITVPIQFAMPGGGIIEAGATPGMPGIPVVGPGGRVVSLPIAGSAPAPYGVSQAGMPYQMIGGTPNMGGTAFQGFIPPPDFDDEGNPLNGWNFLGSGGGSGKGSKGKGDIGEEEEGKGGSIIPRGMGRMFGIYAGFRAVSGIARDLARREQLQYRMSRDAGSMTGSDLLTATSYSADGNAIGDALYSGLSHVPIIGEAVKGAADWYAGSPLIDAKEAEEHNRLRERAMDSTRRYREGADLASESTSVGRARLKTDQEFQQNLREVSRDQGERAAEINREAQRRYMAAGTDDAKREVIRRDVDDQLGKVNAEAGRQRVDVQRTYDAESRLQDREQTDRMAGLRSQAGEVGFRLSGRGDDAERVANQNKIRQEQFAAYQRSKAEGDFYSQNIAPGELQLGEREIAGRRVASDAESAGRIRDINFTGGNDLLRASGDTRRADMAAADHGITERIQRLRDMAAAEDAAGHGIEARQKRDEAAAVEAQKGNQILAKRIEYAHAVGLAAQQSDIGTAGTLMRASSDDLRAMGLDYQAHEQDYQSQRREASAQSNAKLHELYRAGNFVGYDAEVRRSNAQLRGIDARERVYQYQRQREIRGMSDSAESATLRDRGQSSSARLLEMESATRRELEGAGGDPEKEAQIRRRAAAEMHSYQMQLKEDLIGHGVSGTREDAMRSAMAAAFDSPDARRRKWAEYLDKQKAMDQADKDLREGRVAGRNAGAADLNDAARKNRDQQADLNAKAFADAAQKLSDAADKLNDMQLVGVIGP